MSVVISEAGAAALHRCWLHVDFLQVTSKKDPAAQCKQTSVKHLHQSVNLFRTHTLFCSLQFFKPNSLGVNFFHKVMLDKLPA